MKSTLSLLFAGFFFVSYGQTWADDVATIFYNKCTKCHHPGGAGGFSLTTFSDANPLATMIQSAVGFDEMPPWPPNNDYQSYSHDRSLSASEKTTIMDWITNGTPEGDPLLTPPVPTYQTGAIYGSGDLEIQIPTYMSKATTDDDYVCFAMPSNLATNRVIKAVEIVPGNPEIVHHCLIYVDPTSSCVTDTVGGDCGGPSSQTATLITGYTPGSTPMTLPDAAPLKLGMTIPANSQIFFAMHYPEGSYGEYDSTKVIFHFYPPGEPGIRQVSAAPIIQNWNFVLPPDQITNLTAEYPGGAGLPIDYSLLSIFPHMHLLGHEMKVYGIQPNFDTLKLIQLHWDFEWQDFYFYKNIQKAEAGSNLHAEAQFDNTINNTHNPNVPPQTVFPGLNTTDEMFLVYMHYMPYLPGDELHNMDSLMGLSSLSLLEQEYGPSQFSLYPNPFDNSINVYSNNVSGGDIVSAYVYNSQGQIIKRLMKAETLNSDELHIIWDGNNELNEPTTGGLYFISVNVNGVMTQHRVIKKK